MIDWNRISELQNEIGAEDFGEVVELFLDEVEAEIEELRVSTNPAALEAQLHFLKGGALNLGFSDFSQHCQNGESAAARGEHEDVNLDTILKSYEASKIEFLAALSDFTTK